MVGVRSSRIHRLGGREVNGTMLVSGVDNLPGRTEPGTKGVRVRVGLMVPMLDLMSDDMGKRNP